MPGPVWRCAHAKCAPVAATDIAAAMIALAGESDGGVTVVESHDIRRCRV
jgi:hypothetical protein